MTITVELFISWKELQYYVSNFIKALYILFLIRPKELL